MPRYMRHYTRCFDCDRYFVNHEALIQHLKNHSIHWFCHACMFDFDSEAEYEGHWPARCGHCGFRSHNADSLKPHLSETHNYCFSYRRPFVHMRALQQHIESEVHSPKTVFCPLCSIQFSSLTAIAVHVENGKCSRAPHLDRYKVATAIRTWDRSGTLTTKMIEYHQRTDAIDLEDCCYSNGQYKCPKCDRWFMNANNLKMHLTSRSHATMDYKCPNCSREFARLSDLTAHLERSRCGSVANTALGGLMGNMRSLTFY